MVIYDIWISFYIFANLKFVLLKKKCIFQITSILISVNKKFLQKMKLFNAFSRLQII